MKKQSLPALKTKADNITSRYIRQKWADDNGYVKCCTCPTVKHWKEMHCAHFIGRAKIPTRWLEENLRPACPSCNVYRKEYHMREFTLVMIDSYGRDFVDELNRISRKVCKPSEVRQLAEEAIADYTAQLDRVRVIE
jgi:hypothetical protein